MRKKRKIPNLCIVIFLLAAAAAGLAVHLLPVPGEYRRICFILLMAGISFAGVVAVQKIGKR